MESKTNWVVVTGGPCSGKTAVIDLISRLVRDRLDCQVIPEAADILIKLGKLQGKTIEEIRVDEIEFQRQILTKKVEIEQRLSREKIIFLDTAIPDSIAYFQVRGLDPKEVLQFCQKDWYWKVFCMESLPFFEQDGRRTETPEEAAVLNRLLKKAYQDLGYEVISVPLFSSVREISIAKRFLFIVKQVFKGGE